MIRKLLPVLVPLLLLPAAVFARDSAVAGESLPPDPFAEDGGTEEAGTEDGFEDFDSLFDEEMIEIVDEESASEDEGAADDFLKSDGVELGGKFRGSLLSRFDYDNLYTPDFDLFSPSPSLTPSVSADLFFDARPESNYRVFGKLGLVTATGNAAAVASIIPDGGITFEQSTDEDGNITFQNVSGDDVDPDNPNQTTINQDDVAAAGSTQINIQVKELFADFDWDSILFFRFGKSTIKWGVGYFWSPTDVLNLTAIDVEDPTADREGPISLKLHLPVDINNLYLYLITENAAEPLDIAVASKFEFIIGDTEIGLGGYYRRNYSPRLVGTVSTSVGSVAIFGEAAASWGSDRVFVRPSRDQSAAEEDASDALETVLDTYKLDGGVFVSATIGASYLYSFEDDGGSLNVTGQYFFNGEGYDNSTPGLLEAAYRLQQNSAENGLALPAAEQPAGYEAPPALTAGDLRNFGRHYAGLFVSWGSLLGTDFSFSVLSIANFSDLSGFVIPNISYKFLDHLSASAGLRLSFGEPGDEYTNPAALLGLGGDDGWKGPTASFTIEFSIGGGSF